MYNQGLGRMQSMLMGQPAISAAEGGGEPPSNEGLSFDSTTETFDATDRTFDEQNGE